MHVWVTSWARPDRFPPNPAFPTPFAHRHALQEFSCSPLPVQTVGFFSFLFQVHWKPFRFPWVRRKLVRDSAHSFSSVSLCIFLDFSLTFSAEWREPAQSKGVSQEQRENKGKRLQQQQQSAAFREGRLPTVVKWPMPHSWTGRERQGRGDSRRKREHHSGRRGSHIYATRRRPACN